MKLPGLITRTKDSAQRRWRGAKERHHWLDHIFAAWQRYQANHGNHFAAAITYFSFLALFPTLLLAASVIGFVLHGHPALQQTLFDSITSNLPGGFGQAVNSSIEAAVDKRAGVGLVGLAGLILTGLGWIGNLRAAMNAVWGVEPPQKNFVMAKLANLFVLAGLGAGVVVSIGLTVLGTRFTDKLLRATGIDDITGSHTLARIIGIALAIAGDMLIFSWVLARLPRAQLPAGVLFRGALLAAVGFEILKVAGTYYIARVTRSPTVGIFGSVIGVLVWIDLVSRYLLYCAAWTATAVPPAPAPEQAPVARAEADAAPPRALSSLGVAGSLFGAGAAVGGGAVAVLTARRRRRRKAAG